MMERHKTPNYISFDDINDTKRKPTSEELKEINLFMNGSHLRLAIHENYFDDLKRAVKKYYKLNDDTLIEVRKDELQRLNNSRAKMVLNEDDEAARVELIIGGDLSAGRMIMLQQLMADHPEIIVIDKREKLNFPEPLLIKNTPEIVMPKIDFSKERAVSKPYPRVKGKHDRHRY